MNLAKFVSAVHEDGFTFFPTDCKNYGIRAKKNRPQEPAAFEVAVIKREYDVENDVVVSQCPESELDKKLDEAVDLIFTLNDFSAK